MKRILAGVVLSGFLFSGGAAFSESNVVTRDSAAKKASPKKQTVDPSEEEKQKTEEERRKELNDSEWSVTVVKKGGDTAKDGEKDKLVFKDGKMSFKSFEAKGFAPAEYSLVVNPSVEGGTWETYIAGKEAARLSVRGDWRGTVMNGTLVEQTDEKTSQTYYFSSQQKVALAPAEPETAANGEAPAVESPKSLSALVSKEEKRY